MADMKTITVQGVSVEVAQPYAEGHTITAAEAKSLNQTRAENIANNQRTAIKKLLDEKGSTPESVKPAAQALISEYDATYEFTLASVGGGRSKLSPVEKEARKIAKNAILGQLKAKGITQKEFLEAKGEDAIKNLVVEVSERPEVVAAAEKAVKQAQETAKAAGQIEI